VIFEVIPELRGDKWFLPTRLIFGWSKTLRSKPTQAYVLTEKQVGDLFVHPFWLIVYRFNQVLKSESCWLKGYCYLSSGRKPGVFVKQFFLFNKSY